MMALKQMDDFTFKHSNQIDAIYTQYTAQQIKSLFDSRGDELRTALNLLITSLNSVNGASNIGTSTIQDIDGANIQEMLQSIRDKLKSKVDGASGADYINATAIAGLTGETVQSLLKSMKNYIDVLSADKISAAPIAVGSGNTVQQQLAWLLSQIAIAATGSIPDGSLSEVKLTQALINKINTALSNTGVLTTLLTMDKSSLVNALNEIYTGFTSHQADYVAQPANAGTTGGTSTAYTVTTNPAPTSLLDKIGAVLTVHIDSGANPTLKWGDLEAKPIKKPNGNQATLKKDGVYTVRYNATTGNFILQGEGGEYGSATANDVRNTKTIGTENGVIPGALDLSQLISSNIRQGITIDGKTGTLIPSNIASGSFVGDTSNSHTVNGLAFTPDYVIVSRLTEDEIACAYDSLNGIARGYAWNMGNGTYGQSTITVSGNSFTLNFASFQTWASRTYKWVAIKIG